MTEPVRGVEHMIKQHEHARDCFDESGVRVCGKSAAPSACAIKTIGMTEQEFRALLNWFMRSDPWTASARDHAIIHSWVEFASRKLGYDGWVVAYHEMPQDNP